MDNGTSCGGERWEGFREQWKTIAGSLGIVGVDGLIAGCEGSQK